MDWSYVYEPEVGPMACHFDPESFWAVLARTVRDVLDKAGADGRQVVAVSSTSQREGCVLVDGKGKELYGGPNRDLRAHVEGDELARAFGDEIYTRTGHFPSGMFAAARLMWFRRNQPDLYERASRLLMINDWVLYRLSGVCACEPSNAAETCLFDIGRRSWADDLIELLGLRRDLFADVVAPGTRIGAVSAAAAEATGLKVGTPVVAGGADTQCGVLGSGAIDDGDLAVIAGTTAPLQLVLADLTIDPGGRMWSAPFLSADRFVLESNAGGAGTVYRWCLDNFRPASEAPADAGDRYAQLNRAAESVPPGALGARSFLGVTVMDARNVRFHSSSTLELAQLVFHGDTQAAVGRAILESLAFAARANADQIASAAPAGIARVTACGGLTRSTLYVQLLAACMETTIRVPRWREGSGIGAAVCAGVGAGVFADLGDGQGTLVTADLEIEPDPALVSAYRDLYASWRRDYARLRAIIGSQPPSVN